MASAEVLLDRLDSLWRMGIAPNIEGMIYELSEVGYDGQTELCAADLEWRWRTQEQDIQVATHRNIPNLLASPSATDYQSLLGNAWILPACQQRMIDAEWLARSAWGDKPHINDFVAQYRLSELQTESVSQQLNHVLPTQLEVLRNAEIVQVIFCPNDIILGRQNSGEPSSIAWIPESRRLIVADIHQRDLSRNQLRLRRVRAEAFELTNLSKQVSLTTDCKALAAGQTLSKQVPFEFSLNEWKISVSAVSPSA